MQTKVIYGAKYDVGWALCHGCVEFDKSNDGCFIGGPYCGNPTLRCKRLQTYKQAFELAAANVNMNQWDYEAYLSKLQEEEAE